MKKWLLLLVLILGCRAESEKPAGTLNFKNVPDGWGVMAVPENHPQIFIDPDGNYLVKNEDVEKFKTFHGGMKLKHSQNWELKPYNSEHHRLEKINENRSH